MTSYRLLHIYIFSYPLFPKNLFFLSPFLYLSALPTPTLQAAQQLPRRLFEERLLAAPAPAEVSERILSQRGILKAPESRIGRKLFGVCFFFKESFCKVVFFFLVKGLKGGIFVFKVVFFPSPKKIISTRNKAILF